MRFVTLLLAISLPALAQEAPRPIFPSDYTPSPCAPATSCESFPDSEVTSAAFRFLGLSLEAEWVAAHGAAVRDAVAPLCHKHATCLATPGNTSMFCDDVLTGESAPAICNRLFPRDKSQHDWEQCDAYLRTYLLGIDQRAMRIWETAQACAAKLPPAKHTKPLDVWMSPATLPYDYKGNVQFFALDPETKVPLLARITFEDQTIYADANPSGESATYYPFPLPFKYVRVPNKEGHTDSVPPLVTITAAGYPPATFRLPAVVPRVIVEMKPAPASLHAGSNNVTVFAHDSITGRPVDGRIMLGENETGYTNQPITIELPKNGKRPEIWLKPYLNRYTDVVLVPAGK